MKQKITLLMLSLFGFFCAKAHNGGPGDGLPAGQAGKKDELNGVVIHSETKKPLKDVSITAFLSSKKEKVVVSDEEGNFNFDELKPGIYKFIFEKTGYKKVTKEKVVIKTDEAFQMNIEMIESSNFDIVPSPFSFAVVK
ncbi:MAG: carboxypeptidase regulatory-like domain-containing protein [Sphingobacteriales bacterium]|nr:carboxypeptidase regulatory-like domain-containing protein [Sphingobacteriales bacterium]